MTGDSGNLGRNGSGNIVLNQMKNKNDSLYRQDFAEVYIAESVPTKQEKSLSEPIQNRMADEEEKYRLFLEMRQIYNIRDQSTRMDRMLPIFTSRQK